MNIKACDDGYYRGEYKGREYKLPRVTHVLSLLSNYGKVDLDVMRRAQNFGNAVHSIVDLWENDQLDIDSLKPTDRTQTDLTPVLEAWKSFKADFNVDVEETEKTIFHLGQYYAGTLDAVGFVSRNKVKKKTLIEIKTRAYNKLLDPLQTAAYMEAYNSFNKGADKIVRRILVYLKLDGKYQYQWMASKEDSHYFRSVLATYNWKEKNK